jgi:hypothetical protein
MHDTLTAAPPVYILRGTEAQWPVCFNSHAGHKKSYVTLSSEPVLTPVSDLGHLVQLKSASVASASYTTPDEMAWIAALDTPLFIGRVDLGLARIELFTTLRLHQVLLEQEYVGIELLLDRADETSTKPNVRRAKGTRLEGFGERFFALDPGRQGAASEEGSDDWRKLRDRWEHSHVVRAVLAVIALIVLLVAVAT